MNFIIKTIIKKVFQKYLNLEEQLNVESGLIKLPYGKINHEEINKKLEPFNIQISESIYKNLSISIPLTEIVSKPIKISIERFEVVIAKKKRNKSERAQQKQQQQTKQKEPQQLNQKIEIDEQVNKYSKTMPAGKQQVNSGYIKNMVNRLLYNMEILFEKVVIKVQKDEQNQDSQGFEKYLSDVQFEINQLHLRNSLVLLEANIIKKIFNLQQILIRHKFAQIIIKDFNICLDYNNRKLNIIAILGNILLNIKQIPFKQIHKLITPKKNSTQSTLKKNKIASKHQPPLENQHHHHYHHSKQKPIQLNFYIKITQSTFQIQNLLSLRGDTLEIKYKKFQQNPINSQINLQKHSQVELLFKSLLFVHLNQEPYEEKDFIMIRYLPRSHQVKTFSEYEDNILKSCRIKLYQKQIHQRQFSRVYKFKKNESEINSATSFDDKKEETLTHESIKKQITVQLYYLDLMVDFEIVKKVMEKVLKNQDIKALVSISSSKVQKQKQPLKIQISTVDDKQKTDKQELSIQFIVYRLMINIRILNDLSLQLYGSFRGGYFINQNYIDNASLTESSIRKYPLKSGLATEYIHPHTGKHTHKKRNSNKQTSSKISLQQAQRQVSLSKLKPQSIKIQKPVDYHKRQTDTNEQMRLELIQMCIQCKHYKIVDFGNFQVKANKSKTSQLTEITAVGTHLNSQLSVKLIKDIIEFVPLIENEITEITDNVNSFIGTKPLQNVNKSQNHNKQTLKTKEEGKKSRISIFLKLNELNLKLGSLVKMKQNIDSNKQRFVWVCSLQISNLTLGAKLLSALKLKFSTMIYVTSPHTLHRTSITRNPVDFKVDFKSKKQTVISICNDLQLDLNENCLQILLKYFSQISAEPVKIKFDQHSIKNQNTSISDNNCYFVEFYNSTHKQIQIIQANEYEVSQDSINLSEIEDNEQNQTGVKDYKLEQKIDTLKGQQSSILFWLNEYCLVIVIDGYRSLPITLEFAPFVIQQLKSNSKYHSQQEVIIKFEEQNQKVQNKYVVHFLLNSIGKIQRIVLKHNVCFLSYKNSASISHQNSQLIAYSNLVLEDSQHKITDHSIIEYFRNKNFVQTKNIQNPKQFELNYEFLLDLNQESKNIIFTKCINQINKVKYNVSGLLLRSPNSKAENSLYSLFGIYKEKINQNQKEQVKIVSRLFESYLYQIKHLQTTYFVQMPFLIIENNLSCQILLEIFDKKTQVLQQIKLNPLQKRDLYPSSFEPNNDPKFDFYNKQFTMKIKLVSKAKFSENQNKELESQILYESQEHYFNTFFMVQHEFETLIALRSNKKYQFDKKYVFLREQLMLKTKILKLQSSCRIINKTNFNFGLKFRRSHSTSLGQVRSPQRLKHPEQNLQSNTEIESNYVLLPEEQQNNHFVSLKKSEIEVISQFRGQQTLQILFQNLEQTKVQVHQEIAKQGWIQILSFNFAQKDNNLQLQKERKYCHLLFRLRLKTIENHQFIIIQNFITFKNLSLENITLSLEPQKCIEKDEQVIFPLPPTTIKKFNNRVIVLNNASQIQALYEELFSSGFDEKSKSSNTKSKKSSTSQKIMEPNNQKNSQTIYVTVNDKQSGLEQKIVLKDLLYSKNNVQQINLGKKGIKLFSLLKDIKGGIIRLFFLEKLFNPNISYLLLHNDTNKNFLISSDKSEYTHHFIKNPSLKENRPQNEQQKSQKVFIHQNTFSTLSNKDEFELFLCDENGKHLEKSTKQNLEKQGLQMQFHTTGNFQLIDLSQSSEQKSNDSKQASKEPKLSIKTHLISININLYNKIFLNLSLSNLGIRVLQKNKFDCLVQDVSLKNNLNSEHILRIPEESYVLFQGKAVGKQNTSQFILIKNLFVKCKNIIINLEKDLPYRIICLCKNLIPQTFEGGEQLSKKKYYFDNEAVKLFFQSICNNQGLQKLKSYLKQHLFLIKNIYLHEIHLSLSLDLQNNNFSNVMVIPQYQLVNSFMREKNLFKQIGQFYKTNILAKLPKLSFIFQNLKNPVNLFRTMMKVSSALSQKIEQKNILTFDHDEIPQNDLQFSLQRWNFMHKKGFIKQHSNPEEYCDKQELLTFLYKNEFYYIVSNRNFIIMSLNSKNISNEQEGTLIHYESSSEESFGAKSRDKWIRTYENSMMRIIPLKNLEKIKLIRNKKYSQFAIQFKGNLTINICDEYEKCAKLIDTINSLVM